MLLEALSYYSSSYWEDNALIPAYFNLALATRSAPDVDSSNNLQICHDNISYVIKIVGTTFSGAIFNEFEAANYNIASLLKGQESIMEKQLDNVLASFGLSR